MQDLSIYVTDKEVLDFLRHDPVWPKILFDFRGLTQGIPSGDDLTVQECAHQAINAIEMMASPDPERLQNLDLPCALALMYTSAGLRQESSNQELRSALYLLRPIAKLKGGKEHANWEAGRIAIMLASYQHLNKLVTKAGLVPGALMTRLSRILVDWQRVSSPTKFEVNLAKSAVIASLYYPTTREQLKNEWLYLEQEYEERKRFYDTDRRAGWLYVEIKKRGLPNLDKPVKSSGCFSLMLFICFIVILIACWF